MKLITQQMQEILWNWTGWDMAIHQKNWYSIHQTYRISNDTTKFHFYHGTPWVKYWYKINKILNEIADSFFKGNGSSVIATNTF